MNQHKIFYSMLFLLLLVLAGCDEEEKSIYETGPKVVSVICENENAMLEFVVDPSKPVTALVQARMDQLSSSGVVVVAEERLDLVSEYNKKHGTNYEELPLSTYKFVRFEFVFPQYADLSSHIELQFTATDMLPDVSYLLPVKLTEIRGDKNASIDEEANMIYFVLSKLPPPELVHLKDVELTTERGPGKKNWFAAYATNSEGGHTFSIEEAAEQSQFMDFVLLKHGSNLRIHPSIIGWKHGGDYQKYVAPYIAGFEKLTHVTNMNKLHVTDVFNSVTTSEGMAAKIAELYAADKYAYYTTDRMTSHNLQLQISGDNRVLILGWGPTIGKNEQFALLYIKEVTALNGGADYTMKFDIKYVDFDMKTAAANTQGQTVIVDNPDYTP